MLTGCNDLVSWLRSYRSPGPLFVERVDPYPSFDVGVFQYNSDYPRSWTHLKMTSDVSLVLTSDSRNDLMKRVTIALRFYDTSISFELFVYYGCYEL